MPKRRATQASRRVRKRGRVGWQRPLVLPEQLLPSLRVPVLDQRELLEELAALGVALDRGKRPVQVSGIALVGVVLVPGGVGCGLLVREVMS